MTKIRPPNQWQPGQTGNPKGRPPGQSEITRLRSAIADHVPSIIAQLVTSAKLGDVQAARLILERVLPPVKAIELTQQINLPIDGTLTDKGRAVLTAVAQGDLSTGQGAQLLAAIGALGKVAEIDELADRVAALEKKHGNA